MPKNTDAKEIEIEKETPLSVRINGNQNHAMLVVHEAMKIVLEKVRQGGFAIAGTHHTSTSSGAIGYYARKIAEAGFIGFVFSRAPERVAVYGSFEPTFGTNPIAISIPSELNPLVLDMSTAAMSFYGILEAKTAGRQIPEGIAYDVEGNLSTDPVAIISGALRTFDKEFKSSALSMIVEILAGPLVGASFSGRPDSRQSWGHLLFAIDPELFGDRNGFQDNLSRLIQRIKGAQKLPGHDHIMVPGERGDSIFRQAMETRVIEIEDTLLEELRKAAGSREIG